MKMSNGEENVLISKDIVMNSKRLLMTFNISQLNIILRMHINPKKKMMIEILKRLKEQDILNNITVMTQKT
jgi:hypothetical protein